MSTKCSPRWEGTAHLTVRAGRVKCGEDEKGVPIFGNTLQPKPVLMCRERGLSISAEERSKWDQRV